MKQRSIIRYALATVLLLFGALTLFLSTSVIFDLFGIRVREGNYVPVVVWANFIVSILYVQAAAGLMAHKRWTLNVLFMAVLILVGACIAFGWHVFRGGIHEQKTIGALTFRTLFTLSLYIGALRLFRMPKVPLKPRTMITDRLLLTVFLPLMLMAAGCGTGAKKEPVTATPDAQHERGDQVDATQADEVTPDDLPKVKLDDQGQRWVANPETTAGIVTMAATLDAYDPANGDSDTLKAALENEFALIFERCTMTGESHNQLHNYLIPIHQALREFDGTAAHDREAMAAHLATYATYFQ